MLKIGVLSPKNSKNRDFTDEEFGLISVARSSGARLSVRLNASGALKLTAPAWISQRQILNFIEQNRSAIRHNLLESPRRRVYREGEAIGKNHLLKIVAGETLSISVRPNFLVLNLPKNQSIDEPEVQNLIRSKVAQILRRQARNYLPERLSYLARKHGFSYQKIRLSHATTRWGSCSSRGTISLNISLMTLPNELIDYVIIHELCHTRHMNHSRSFWQEVAQILPNYKLYEKQLKRYSAIV